jgi:hypothetical protein
VLLDFQFYNWKLYFRGKKSKILPTLPDNKYVMTAVFVVDLVTYFDELSMKFQGKNKRLCDTFPDFKSCDWKLSMLDKYISESLIPRPENLLLDHSSHRLTGRSCKTFSFTSFN